VRPVRSVAELIEGRLVGLGAVMGLYVAFWLVGYFGLSLGWRAGLLALSVPSALHQMLPVYIAVPFSGIRVLYGVLFVYIA
jgi:hypothetical protein